jgi:predicted MFS family arabinose efflux permease
LLPDAARAGRISLERANSIHEALFSTGFAIGPALAAVSIVLIGAVNSFWIVAFFTLLSAVFVGLIRVEEEYDDDPEHHGVSWFTYALEGFRALPKYPAVLLIFLAFVSLALVYLPTEMLVLPRYYNQIKDPTGLGVLISTMGFFGAIGSLSFEQIAKRFSYSTIMRITLIGVTTAVVIMSFLPPQPLMLLGGALIGSVWGPLPPLLNTVIQKMVPAAMRGRVFSIEITIWSAAPMISMFFVGLMVDGIGVQLSYWVLATLVAIAAITIGTSRHVPKLRAAQAVVEEPES